ncbi:MAG TPA: flippase-like domain-containing protein, partial [Burkholderiales bacterium]|nr:flippase-like domain-containing protein [Burkholderiales bacterium]
MSVVVPAHNEEDNLPRVLDSLVPTLQADAATADYEIVVVNDNSRDKTGEIADRYARENVRIRIVHRTETPGFGNAVRAGLLAAAGDAVVPFMGDLSDDPADIPRMRRRLDEGFDVVYGSRFVSGGDTEGYPRGKMFANRAFNNVVRLLFGIKFRDFSNAFKMYRREVIDAIGPATLESNHFDLTVELPLRAHILGFRATEIPVVWHGRDKGEAKFNVRRMGWRYGRRLGKLFVSGAAISLADLVRAIYSGSKLRLLAGALAGLLLLVGIASVFGGADAFARVASASIPYVAGAALLSLGALYLRVVRWQLLLRAADYPVAQESAYRCIMFGWFLNYVLPARVGDFARALALRTVADAPVGTSLASIVLERALDLLVLASLLTIGFFPLVATQTTIANVVLLSGVLIAILLAGLGVVAYYNGFLQRPA